MRKILFAMVVCAATFFSSCEEEQKDPVYLHQSTKDFFAFKDGSTWTYINENKPGGEVEYNSTNYQQGISNPGVIQTEFLKYDLNPDSGDKISIRAEAGPSDPVDRIIFINYNDTGLVYDPIIWNNGNSFYAGNGRKLTMLDTLTVNGKLYEDVMYIKSTSGALHKDFYYARGVGIIKKELNNSGSYTIKSYNVIR